MAKQTLEVAQGDHYLLTNGGKGVMPPIRRFLKENVRFFSRFTGSKFTEIGSWPPNKNSCMATSMNAPLYHGTALLVVTEQS